ncbi:serine protease Do [Abditibacterium utsteinense]|uniref:Serine protease Do n=1 Tax=Abditibacterium utsteinense TaxID=1960156 RepID=A0A2S8SNX2_9BACT|nr:Do family serine endopeptidase [Abditibacterium utsteinense]PQV62494.1 serine protease Do [Abditibacterium utsteinense]
MSDFNNNRRTRRALQAGVVIAAIGSGYALRDMNVVAQNGAETTAPPTQKAPVVQTAATRDAASMQGAFADVAAAVEPAVVTITNAGSPDSKSSGGPSGRAPRMRPFGQGQSAPQGADPFNGGDLQEFFKQFQRNFGFNEQSFNSNSWQGRVLRDKWADAKAQFVQERGGGRSGGGLGSGMIYRSDGLIITNAHVVKGATTVLVTLSDGRKFEKAKVLGRDERTDIAVVKIDATNLPTVKLGDSDDPRVGDWAIAVGNPFGLDHTLTVGVISAKARQLRLAEDTRTDYLQTDASINPGNSGGPLLDIYGRVIGVNNAIYSESGGNQGIGFAIPVNTARFVADKIVKDGRVRRSYLGVKISNVEDTGTAFGLDPKLKGVLIQEVSDPNTPGAKAGLQPGDVVTQFNGKNVSTSSELQALVGNSAVGSNADLTVVRNGKTINLTAKLDELKDDSGAKPEAPNAPNSEPMKGQTSIIPGLKLRNLSPDVARALGIKATKGVAITDVTEGSAADDAGLQRGDVIERVGQTPITGMADFGTAVSQILGGQSGTSKKVALYVNRGDQRSFVFVTIE